MPPPQESVKAEPSFPPPLSSAYTQQALTPKKATGFRKKAVRAEADPDAPKRVNNTGYNAPLRLSEELADIVGEETMSRPQVVKNLWFVKFLLSSGQTAGLTPPWSYRVYIKANDLQVAANRKFIAPDYKLSKVLGRHPMYGVVPSLYSSFLPLIQLLRMLQLYVRDAESPFRSSVQNELTVLLSNDHSDNGNL